MEKTRKKLDIWSIFMYLILYSVVGFVIETVFGAFTKGVIESRKSFLYGPFCAIYGIGAIAMIVFLRNQKSLTKIFFGGAIIGAIVEYGMSLICEVFFGVKWWDYSGALLNIHGRTCLFYAVSWGVLSIVLLKIVNPYVDKFIEILRQKKSLFQVATVLLIAFFTVDAALSGYAIKVFYYRVASQENLNIEDKSEVYAKYSEIEKRSDFVGAINKYYDNEKMIKTYPNIMIEEKNENTVHVESLIDGVEPYYYLIGKNFAFPIR